MVDDATRQQYQHRTNVTLNRKAFLSSVQPYDGIMNPNFWSLGVDNHLTLHDVSHEFLLLNLHLYMQAEKVTHWFQSVQHTLQESLIPVGGVAPGYAAIWTAFKTSLNDNFSRAATLQSLKNEAKALKINACSTPTEYVHRKTSLMRRINPTINDEGLLTGLKKGLPSHIRTALLPILTLTPANLVKVLEGYVEADSNIFRKEESSLASSSKNSNATPKQSPQNNSGVSYDYQQYKAFRSTLKCTFCEATGHEVFECRKKLADNRQKRMAARQAQVDSQAPTYGPRNPDSRNYTNAPPPPAHNVHTASVSKQGNEGR